MTIILSIMVIASFALMIGAVLLGQKQGWSIKFVLMIVLAIVIMGNAALLSIPNDRGLAPAEADFKS